MSDEDFQRAIQALIEQAAPDRGDELSALWRSHSPKFRPSTDESQFKLEAGAFGIVLLNRRAILTTWIITHEAWAAIHAFAGQIWALDRLRLLHLPAVRSRFGKVVRGFRDQVGAEEQITTIAAELGRMEAAIGAGGYSLPASFVPFGSRPTDPKSAAIYDWAALTLAALILHEINHVRDANNGVANEDARGDELRSDRYGAEVLLGRVSEYARKWMVSPGRVRLKRAGALAIAMYVVCRVTPAKAAAGTSSHPSLRIRMRSLIACIAVPRSSKFWIVLAAVLLADLTARGGLPDAVHSTNAERLCAELADLLPS
jgi:hypothetical protein